MIEYINRSGTSCYKWDSEESRGLLPLWVADMDFKVAQPIMDALQRRLNPGVFGYQYVPQAYYDAVSNWFARRHNWKGITRENIICTTGVVSAISSILRAMTKPEDGVVIHTPAYNCFFSCLTNLECRLLENPLIVNNEHFEINWQQFEKQMSRAKIFLLCNPHNPTGRVWTHEELKRMAAICEQNKVFVIADEIHCEFTFPNISYTPYATVAKTTNFCVCTSPSKAFNTAGLHCANIIVPDADIYQRIDHAVNIHEVGELNPFGVEALIAAYNECEAWLDELQQVIHDNYCYLRDFMQVRLPQLKVSQSEGTFLAWVNVKALKMTSEELCQHLANEEKVLFNPAEMYGGKDYIRINIATSRENLTDALQRLQHFVNSQTY